MNQSLLATALAAALSLSAGTAAARDYISVVGSSTVYPFSTVVAEQFGKTSSFKTPKIESTGTGGGMKLFCAGVGVSHPDIANASRRIKKSEYEDCQKNGVADIVEVKIGYDGIAVANAKGNAPLALTRQDLFLALAKEVPDPKEPSQLIANPYKTWQQVNPALPAAKIEVLGPPPTSGTRDAFVELVLDEACKKIPAIEALKADKNRHKAACQGVREDGAYIEAGENDNLIVQKLIANPNALGIFGFSFLDQNTDKVQGCPVEGVAPSFETIADGRYPVSRPLYFYVKKAHQGAIPGIAEYVAEFVSDKAAGSEGYLSERGLIPLPEAERGQVAHDAKGMVPMKL